MRRFFYLCVGLIGVFLLCGSLWAESGDPVSLRVIWNRREISLDQPLLKKQGVVMVPLRDILTALGGTLRYSRLQDRYTLELKPSMSVILEPGTVVFSVNQARYTFSLAPMTDEGIFYVPLEGLLKAIGYRVEWREDRVIIQSPSLIKPSQATSVFFNSNEIEIPLTLLQLKATLARLDPLKFKTIWTDKTHVRALPLIQVSVGQKNTGPYFIQLLAPFSLRDATFKYMGNGEYRIDFGWTQGLPTEYKPTLNTQFTFSYKNISPTTSRLTVKTQGGMALSGLVSDRQGGRLYLETPIFGISESYGTRDVTVTLKLPRTVHYRVAEFTDPPRLVLDLPNTLPKFPSLFTPARERAPYQRIRTSQFKLSPSMTRVVFDLNEASNLRVSRVASGLQLCFSPPPSPSRTGSKLPTHPIERPIIERPPPLLLAGRLIVVDAGHGGDDPGAIGRDGTYEKEFTLDIAQRLRRLLVKNGAHVMMTREGDQNPGLEHRAALANINKADLFISIHINSFFSPFSNGTETYFYKDKDQAFATAIHQSLVKSLHRPDKGVKKARLYVLRNTAMPAVLIEPFFITHQEECFLLNRPYMRQRLAEGICEGVFLFYKK